MDLEKDLKKLNIKRDAKIGVGKKMGNHIWVHKDYVTDLMHKEDYNLFHQALPEDFDFTIIRYDTKKNEIAFIECNDFDTANEPTVGAIYRVNIDNDTVNLSKILNPPKDPLIYHHKWCFVKDDYIGFDVHKSQERSFEWKSVLGVNKEISNKIGRLSFWDNWLEDQNLSSRMPIKNNIKNKETVSLWGVYSKIGLNQTISDEVVLTQNDGTEVVQAVSSSKTARAQLPKTAKTINLIKLDNKNPILLDVGCGSGNQKFKDHITELNIDYNGCDLYNQTIENNLLSISKCKDGKSDIVTLNNVLNTIAEEGVRKSVLEQCENAISDNGAVLIAIYEGEKNPQERKQEKETGVKLDKLTAIKTRDGWQNRMKTSEYLDEVKAVFPNVELMNINGVKLIVASKNTDLSLKNKFISTVKNKPLKVKF